MAAAAAGVMLVRPPLDAWPSLKELSADYRTAKGEQRKVELQGASLELNTQTSLALRATDANPVVELISGETSVASSRSPQQPLVIKAVEGRIVADTAQFNVRCLGDNVTVTCLRGVVAVEAAGSTVSLGEGRQVSYDGRGLAAVVSVNPEAVNAWKTGFLIFEDQPLAAVVDEINRYRSGHIIIVRQALAQRVLSGTFRIQRLDDFLPQVEQLLGARATELPGGIVLLS
jgi:transmembrane sensor